MPGSFSRYSASWREGAGLTDMLGDGGERSVSQYLRVLSHDRLVMVWAKSSQ